ncbi:Stem-specific protein TSJT1 [Apostasia shenzhenica]|uniref:Stem-specific protein TSJT1 n=1 Tax=Apostasia shenzhenica TaxID=1088818 RepID=A0A2I0AJY0_9ASPA|nr:Stem-specific protein TSJT1 [Apostasia shenzhenica]
MVDLQHHYHYHYGANEVMLVVEVYRVLRDGAPYPPDQQIKDFDGKKFAFPLSLLK